MSITYINEIKNITDALYTILKNEFYPSTPVLFSDEFNIAQLKQKNEYIRFCSAEPSDSELTKYSNGECRQYNIDLHYYINQSKYRSGNFLDEIVTPKVEHLKRLLMNNRCHEPNDVYKWHDLKIDIGYINKNTEELKEHENIKDTYLIIIITKNNDI